MARVSDLKSDDDDSASGDSGQDQERPGWDFKGYNLQDRPAEPDRVLGLRLWDSIMEQRIAGSDDERVRQISQEYLNAAWLSWDSHFLNDPLYNYFGPRETYVDQFGLEAYYAKEAFSLITKTRQLGDSRDANYRNAQYYLRGYSAGISKDPLEIAMVLGSPLYELAKAGAHGLEWVGWDGPERAMREGPNHTSPVGAGWLWAWRGLAEGLADSER